MKVQRIQLTEAGHCSWVVLDDHYLPIAPIVTFLKFLDNLGRSPHTRRATAHHLKLFWEFLRDEHLLWTDVDVAQLAAFVGWLRLPDPSLVPFEVVSARRTDATIDQILTSIHVFYDFHMRLKSVADIPLYHFLMVPNRRYKPFLHGFVKTKLVQSRVVKVKREHRRAKTLTKEQIAELIAACPRLRDRFLLSLLYETGMRIGQVLGLRHEDIRLEDQSITIVPRANNVNGARAKSRRSYVIPDISPSLMRLYTDYLIEELGALEADHLPDYVFVNLWEGEVGRPMTYETVMSLVRRLRKKTGIAFAPHLFRHTRATIWLRDDHLSLETTAHLLGHASIQTTHDTYIHLTAQEVREELRASRSRQETIHAE